LQEWAITKRRRHLGEDRELDEILALTLPNNRRDVVIKEAQKVWSIVYGSTRNNLRPRIDLGLKRKALRAAVQAAKESIPNMDTMLRYVFVW
jgi:hypothetical protein